MMFTLDQIVLDSITLHQIVFSKKNKKPLSSIRIFVYHYDQFQIGTPLSKVQENIKRILMKKLNKRIISLKKNGYYFKLRNYIYFLQI